ncbi:uncharacterized protein F4807DRAFT_462951 [Annulohypoxylon truncatum]|uniref:uncharacterized protein n=1 Tax=Annulohypoxylon truncatum TaxID=327061 RepID=UPI002008E03A|nr:uncharacterized protein F4807DRAFT_462951 [Annulohypoxylon truncatum]KAI1207222.1 hypothetical protein F4807DRAFT_462951 [Annulohypoxylon truncatum]
MGPQNPPASYGTDGATPPVLPAASFNVSIIFEWAALLPLAIYLARSRLPHQLVGQAALAGLIGVGLFPRLGVLGTIADFLQQDQEFLDCASSVSEMRHMVWDANWGSIFPCANGAAAAMLNSYVLRNVKTQLAPEHLPKPLSRTSSQSSSPGRKSNSSGSTPSTNETPGPGFRRYQTLHILHFSDSTTPNTRPLKHKITSSYSWAIFFEASGLIVLLGVSIICILYGLYGTAAAVVLTILFRISRQLITIERPAGYLHNNEGDLPGCMLMALHENASTWYLYVGSRGTIDTVLNKTMIQSIRSPLNGWLAHGLRGLEVLQLIIMSYVAAQKGWDGIALLCLILAAWIFDWIVYSDQRVAGLWLQREGITVKAQSLKFGGRTPMIGLIHALSNKKVTSWMDGIISSSDRRAAWLQKLGSQNVEPELEQQLSQRDKEWVDLNETLTRAALEATKDIGNSTNDV